MALYRYTSNKDPWDSTESIIVAVDDDGAATKVMHQGGAPVELDDAEAKNAKRRFNLTKLSDEQAEKYTVGANGVAVPAEVVEDDDEPEPPKPRRTSGRSRRQAETGDQAKVSPERADGGVVDPTQGGGTGADAGAEAGDGQGSRGASGQDVGTTTGGSR